MFDGMPQNSTICISNVGVMQNKLTEADAIFVSAALRIKHKYESEHQYTMLDVRFYLARLSATFTGTEGMNFLPTCVHAMEERLSGDD